MTISRATDSHSRAVIRRLVKHAFDAEILVYVGPVHTITIADDLEVVPLGRSCFTQTP
jgi:hypothetical protein